MATESKGLLPDPADEPLRELPRWSAGLALVLYAAVAVALVAWGPVEPRAARHDVFLLERELPKAAVSVGLPGTSDERSCEWRPQDQRFVCGTEPWAFVGPLAGYAGGEALRCTWMHPLPGGATTILRFRDTGLGDKITGRLALLDEVGDGAEVSVRVFAAGTQVVQARVNQSRKPADLLGKIEAGAPRGELRIELRSSDHHYRHACLALQMTGTRQAPPPPDRAPSPKPASPGREE
ncbi:MAG: hypothetical protein ACOYOB_04755 [Myxococcota bacterium]